MTFKNSFNILSNFRTQSNALVIDIVVNTEHYTNHRNNLSGTFSKCSKNIRRHV